MLTLSRNLSVLFIFIMIVAFSEASFAAEQNITPMDSRALLKIVDNEGKGKIVVVNIFASWCPPCKKEIPDLIEIRKKYNKDQLVLIGVSMDEDMDALRDFIKQYKFNYPLYLASGDFVAAYEVSFIPQLLIFDPSGELVASHTGMVTKEEFIEAIDTIIKENK